MSSRTAAAGVAAINALQLTRKHAFERKFDADERTFIAVNIALDGIELISLASNNHDRLITALTKAEAFIAGFEGDDLQEGIGELLSDIRAALASAVQTSAQSSKEVG